MANKQNIGNRKQVAVSVQNSGVDPLQRPEVGRS